MPTIKAIISQTIDQFADVGSKLLATTRVGIQDPDHKTRTEAATVQAIVDKGLEAHAFEPADPAINAHVNQVSGNPHRVNAIEVGSPTVGEFSAHVNNFNNPHQVNGADVGKGTAQWNADSIQDVPVSGDVPTAGQALVFDGSQYSPGNVSGEFLTFVPHDAANMQVNTLFLDSATGKLSYKDNAGITYLVPMGSQGANQVLYTDDSGLLSGMDMLSRGSQMIIISPDGKNLQPIITSKFEMPVAWIVFDDSEAVSSIAGEQPFTVPQSPLSGYQLVDVMVRCATPSAGSLVVDILKNGVSMMSSPITLTNTPWVDMASDPGAVIKDPPESIVLRGDAITYVASLTGDAPLGFSITIVLRAV